MSTKVKGDKIKEGSIPLSALDNTILEAIPYVKYNGEPIVINIKKGVTEYNLSIYLSFGTHFKFNNIVHLKDGSNFDTNLSGPTITGRFEEREATYLILNSAPIIDETVLLYPNVSYKKIEKKFLPDDIGEAIKEGSIPLSALSDDVLNGLCYLDDELATLNKNGDSVQLSNIHSNYYVLFRGNIKCVEPYYYGQYPINNGPPMYLNIERNGDIKVITLIDNYNINEPVKIYSSIHHLPSEAIADNSIVEAKLHHIVREKINNRADWNAQPGEAGYIENKPDIDPVVWKYMCNPCIISSSVKVPEELIGEYSENIGPYNEDIDGPEGGYCLKYPIFAMYKIMITSEDIDLEYGATCTTIITPTKVTKEYIALTDLYVSKDYGVVLENVFIDKNKKWKFYE